MPQRSARPYSRRHAVAAVGLDGRRRAAQPGVGRRELRHVRGLARGDAVGAVVVQPGRLLGHQPGQLELDLGLGERMGDALVRPIGTPHTSRSLAYADARCERVAADRPCTARRSMIRSGLSPANTWRRPSPSSPTQPVGGHLDVVEEQRELLLGARDLHRDLRAARARARRCRRRTGELGRARCARRSRCGATTSTRGASSTPEMYVLRAAQPVHVAVACRRGRDVRWLFEPASGSVIANTIFSPATSRAATRASGRRCRTWRSPRRRSRPTRGSAATGSPGRRAPRSTIASSAMPAPPPPYSSGRCTPRKPWSATAFHSSSGRSSSPCTRA